MPRLFEPSDFEGFIQSINLMDFEDLVDVALGNLEIVKGRRLRVSLSCITAFFGLTCFQALRKHMLSNFFTAPKGELVHNKAENIPFTMYSEV